MGTFSSRLLMQMAVGPQDPHCSVGEGYQPCLHSWGGGCVEAAARAAGHARCLVPIKMPLGWPLPRQSQDSGALSRASEVTLGKTSELVSPPIKLE